jgi:hypothetical protein
MSKLGTTITARPLVDLRQELEPFQDPVRFGVSCDGTVLAVARTSTEDLYKDGSFAKSRLDRPTDYLVLAWKDGDLRKVEIRAERVAVSYVQPVSSGILLVGARCQWGRAGAEKNAVIYDWTGREKHRFTLGDGLQDVRTTADGTIWASYFDEGVFGNHGWANPGPAPIGEPGLVAFDEAGNVRWSYDAEAAKTDAICDAYALNVRGPSDAWVYFYTEFCVVHISQGRYRVWKLGERGARAIAVRERGVLLFGDYKDPGLARVVELGATGSARVVRRGTVADPEGGVFDAATAIGVGGSLYLIRDRRVFVVDGW